MNLFVPGKLKYVKKIKSNKADQSCILCNIIKNKKGTANLVVFKDTLISISFNVYPYSPGHLIIFLNRHIIDISTGRIKRAFLWSLKDTELLREIWV